jgi:hypothetical protein
VHVITRENNRTPIEAKLREQPLKCLTFHYYDLPSPAVAWKNRGGYYRLLPYYYFWQFGVWRIARQLHKPIT